jgi:CBS domain-containing protein
MTRSVVPDSAVVLQLRAETAADLMTDNPISIPENAVIQEAIAMLTDKGFSAAPVIDEAGRPVGVLSRTDILVHERETGGARVATGQGDWEDLEAHLGVHRGFQVRDVDRTRVRDVMTPAVFCVAPATPAAEVVRELLRLGVHRLFVVDDNGVLVGVVSGSDILRHLRP